MTKNAEHTPGPWNTSALSDGTQWTVCNAESGDMIADLSGTENEIANARLIAAAPDYRESCKGLPQITDGESTTDYDKRVLAWFYLNAGKLHAANLKATGKAA